MDAVVSAVGQGVAQARSAVGDTGQGALQRPVPKRAIGKRGLVHKMRDRNNKHDLPMSTRNIPRGTGHMSNPSYLARDAPSHQITMSLSASPLSSSASSTSS